MHADVKREGNTGPRGGLGSGEPVGCSSGPHWLPLPGLLIEHSVCAGCWGHRGTDSHSPCPSSAHQWYRESGTCKGKSGTVICPVVGCHRSRRLGGHGWVLTHKPGQEGASGEMGCNPVGRGRTLGGLSPQRSRKPSGPSLGTCWRRLDCSRAWNLSSGPRTSGRPGVAGPGREG